MQTDDHGHGGSFGTVWLALAWLAFGSCGDGRPTPSGTVSESGMDGSNSLLPDAFPSDALAREVSPPSADSHPAGDPFPCGPETCQIGESYCEADQGNIHLDAGGYAMVYRCVPFVTDCSAHDCSCVRIPNDLHGFYCFRCDESPSGESTVSCGPI